ncbi:2-hydroxychromene-2-carboxylate isomerase [Hoeflea sp. YIM 152468]|uniref:2-hydroxychromene-2-carboxylate isomerase n=1 Tax=Hoeflea sp. YIM 152468 TaxID=3031759 RepID=UPI0023D9E33F|nr:2-hydroxychromene-2-carboxylate isomerase [Hoeflea sp. YIM 152468]MDF1608777.1 2-hydroxychromene-2-carboxylate isomerase [Hoeflea sp. YIM 152468]
MSVIDYYFYCASPFTYLGHNRICEVAERHKATLNYKPVNLAALWDISGAVPPGQRPPVRQRLRLIELQRLAAWRNLPIKTTPKYWPVDAALADRIIIALVNSGHDPRYFMSKVLSGVWAYDENIADEAVLISYLSQVGLDAAPAIAEAKTDEIAAIRERNSSEAIAADAVGVPTYVLNGEPFWGQDRIELLDEALSSGRKPIRAH